MSRWGLHHSSFRAPIEAFVAAIFAVMSSSSRRLYDIREPRYLNVPVKLKKPSATGKFFVLSSQSYMSCSRSVCPGSCSSSLSEELIMRCPLGWYAANDFRSMRMMMVGCSSGVNMTYFLVCLQTVPALPANAGWDEVTVTRHSMWKSVGHVERRSSNNSAISSCQCSRKMRHHHLPLVHNHQGCSARDCPQRQKRGCRRQAHHQGCCAPLHVITTRAQSNSDSHHFK
jgi:hypothetical protein